MRKKFGQVLLEQGLITPAQLADALTYQGQNGMRLGQALVARGYITEDQLVIALGQALSTRVVDLSRLQPEAAALDMVQGGFASEHDLIPISVREEHGRKHLTVAVADPLNLRALDELGFMTNAQIEPLLAKSTVIDMAIRRHYGQKLLPPYKSVPPAEQVADNDSPHLNGVMESFDALPQVAAAGTGPIPLADAKEETVPISTDDGKSGTGPIPLADTKSGTGPIPLTSDEKSGTGPIPLTRMKRSESLSLADDLDVIAQASAAPEVGGSSQFDAELGALLDAAGDEVHGEALGRLERRFWALMRVLTKRGLVNSEEFLLELNEEESTWGPRP
ncbi:MAG: hypothetical protein AAF449_12785 [Myxococcota bacterium]